MKKFILATFAGTALAAALPTGAMAEAANSVTVTKFHQSYPYSGKATVEYTVGGAIPAGAVVEITIRTDDASATFVQSDIVTGANTNVIDFTSSFGGALVLSNASFVVTITEGTGQAGQQVGGVQLWEYGPYWAECNVGASEPEEYGYYFWWGDTVGYTPSGGTWYDYGNGHGYYNGVTWVSSTGEQMSGSPFSESSCPTCDKDNSTLQLEGWIDATGNLAPEYDAATAHLGALWRMPTDGEHGHLINNCDWTWTTKNGVDGYEVRGRGNYASNCIFLPAAGNGYVSRLEFPGSEGSYWSSTPNSGAWDIFFVSGSNFSRSDGNRYNGRSVRPVRGSPSAAGVVTFDPVTIVIGSVADWDAFSAAVAGGLETEGVLVLLANDIGPVTSMVGDSVHPFAGVFNGNGHTLTVAISGTGDCAAPFSVIDGATILNLVVTGTVSGGNHSAGLVGTCGATGPNVIRDCTVSVAVSGTGYLGGIVGHGGQGTLSFAGCVFSGAVSGFSAFAGGLMGWSNTMALNVTNCLSAGTFAPAGGGAYHPIACKRANQTVTATVADAYWIHTIVPTTMGSYLIPGAEGAPVSATLVAGEWAQPVTAADGNTYYAWTPAPAGRLLARFSFDDAGNGGLNLLHAAVGQDAIVRATQTVPVAGIGDLTAVTDAAILSGLAAGDGAVAVTNGQYLAVPIPAPLLSAPGRPYTVVMKIRVPNSRGWRSLVNMPASNDTDAMIYLQESTRNIYLKQFSKASGAGIAAANGFVPAEQWATLTFAFGENATDVWLDGTAVFHRTDGNLAGSYADCAAAGGYILVGADDSGDDDLFYLSDFRIYEGAVAVAGILPGSGTPSDPYVISSTADWNTFATNMTTGTYRVTDDMTVGERIVINGDVTLILDEGKTLTVPKGIAVNEGNSLTIEGTGALNATAERHYAAIGSDDMHRTTGTIHIKGGTITAEGGMGAAGIGGGYRSDYEDIVISGGTIVATGGERGAGIGGGSYPYSQGDPNYCGTIAISGGTVVATGGDLGAGIGGGRAGVCGTITISGGRVTANAGEMGSGIGSGYGEGPCGTVTLGWTSESDFICATNYAVKTLTFAEGKQFYFVDGGVSHIATPDNMAGKKLMPYVSSDLVSAYFGGIKAKYIYTGNAIDVVYEVYDAAGQQLVKGTHYTESFSPPTVKEVGEYTLAITAVDGSGYTGSKSFGFSVVKFDMNDAVVTGCNSFYRYTGELIEVSYSVAGLDGNPLVEGTDYTGKFSPSTIQEKGDYTLTLTAASVGYTGSKTIHFMVGDGIPVTSDMTVLNDNWYLVSDDVTIDELITINGEVTLILGEGKTLNATHGIELSEGNKLTITGTGTLNADASRDYWFAGIGASAVGTLVIEDGIVNAKGGYRAAGIGGNCFNHSGGTIIINGGTVTATGGVKGAGIGGGDHGESGEGNGMCGTIIINGGRVTANGGEGAAGMGAMDGDPVGGSITLGWTDEDDFIYASSYGNVASVGFADGKYFYWLENGIKQPATSGNIDGKTLLPLGAAFTHDLEYLGVSGVALYYLYDGNEFRVNYRVNDFDGNELVEGTHFTAEFSPTIVKEIGEYTLTLTAIDGSGYTGTKVIPFAVVDGLPVTASTMELDGQYGIPYQVSGDVAVEGRITIRGDVTLILDEGKTLTASKGIELSAGNKLTIEGLGALVATTAEDHDAGIGAKDVGTLVVNGGNVYAEGGNMAAGIGGCYGNGAGGTIIINGGEVVARGQLDTAAIGGGLLGSCGTITINGGKVNAQGLFYGGVQHLGIGPGRHLESMAHKSGTVTFGWTTADDAILATGFGNTSDGKLETLRVADGKVLFCAATGKFYAGTLDDAQRTEIAGKWLTPAIVLADGADNSAAIAAADGMTLAVQLAGRTLAKDGSWQTLCLPFDMTAGQVAAQLAPSALATLRSSSFADGTLALTFAAASAIEAGKPYIVRWSGGGNLVDPVFTNVAVRAAAAPVATQYADFVGSFSPVEIAVADADAFLVGTDGIPVQSAADTVLGACRAWFRLKGAAAGGGATHFEEEFLTAYDLWAAENGIVGPWNATDASGIHNVFRYVFDVPTGAITNPPLIDIEIEGGNAVVITPPVSNTVGFTVSVVESSDVAGATVTRRKPLDATGRTVFPMGSAASRFYRLSATEGGASPGGVQLWENGPYWAECNVGASEPEEFGYYFWWGDTVGYTRSGGTLGLFGLYTSVTWVSSTGEQMSSSPFSPSSCPTYGMDNSTLQSEGYIDATGNLTAAHDAATAHLGAPWRMPMDTEFAALTNNCTATWITTNGVRGCLVTGTGAYADRSIFLPAPGYGSDSTFGNPNLRGYYWSSTPDSDNSYKAWYLDFNSSLFQRDTYYGRQYGLSVRPVRDAD